MPLWDKTDAAGSKPKYLTTAEKNSVFFVDIEESKSTASRAKGIRTPGWNKITSRVDSSGNERFSVECLVALSVPAATSGDLGGGGDPVSASNFAITVQPVNATAAVGAAASFTVTAAPAGGTFQWQIQTNGTGAYTNITNGGVYSGATTATLSISNSTGLYNNRYRVVAKNASADTTIMSKGAKIVLP
jgi:hypothetical protein